MFPADPETGYQGNCGNTIVAIAYLLTYLVISFLIVINMYIAVILENYSQATEDVTVRMTLKLRKNAIRFKRFMPSHETDTASSWVFICF